MTRNPPTLKPQGASHQLLGWLATQPHPTPLDDVLAQADRSPRALRKMRARVGALVSNGILFWNGAQGTVRITLHGRMVLAILNRGEAHACTKVARPLEAV